MKIDAFGKLANLRANLTAKGNLFNFVGHEIEKYYPELMKMTEHWVAIWAAAELSFKQIVTDINNLEKQLNTINQEYIRLNDGAEIVGLDGKLESRASGACTNPLFRRLDLFLTSSKPRLAAATIQMKGFELEVEKLMKRYH